MSGVATMTAEAIDYWDLDTYEMDCIDEEGSSALTRVEKPDKASEMRAMFDVLADELMQDSMSLSSTRRAMTLPAFQEMLAMGNEIIPLVVERIDRKEGRPVWMRLLGTMTTFSPGAGADTIEESARKWIRWSKSREILN